MKIREIENFFYNLYPSERACDWDNDGLLVCQDRDREVSRVLTCLDVTFSAIERAISENCQLIVSHHPLIFSPVSHINEDSLVGQKILLLLQNDISLISLHTRFDGAINGLNERFGRSLGLILRPAKPLLPQDPYIGAMGDLPVKCSPEQFAQTVSSVLNAPVKLYSAALDISTVGFCCGAAKDLVLPALNEGADAFVGGDISYHIAQEAVERGISVIDCGHHASEKNSARYFSETLAALSDDLKTVVFEEDLGGEIVDFSRVFC